jgi:hypothetical protein
VLRQESGLHPARGLHARAIPIRHLPALSIDTPKKPTPPTVGKPLGSGLGGLNKLVSSIAGAFKNSSARTPVAAGSAAGSTGDK